METSHQPTSCGVPQPIRGLLVNQASAHKESDTLTTDSERIRQLENENAKLREERDILRKAAKYFAEETRW